jgi:hypothetical protein
MCLRTQSCLEVASAERTAIALFVLAGDNETLFGFESEGIEDPFECPFLIGQIPNPVVENKQASLWFMIS